MSVDDAAATSLPSVSVDPGGSPAEASRSGRSPWARLLAWGALLLVAYLALSFVNDPRGTLGADEGAKVATLKVMSERNTFRPDVPYWAAQYDPEGKYHGLVYSTRIGDDYINVTTLPMILAARPLWDLGGYRAALLLPMLGGVATAFAARALAMRIAPGKDRTRAGTYAFWIVGLASPVTIYALDLWEHTLGLAAMAWGVVLLVDASGIGRDEPDNDGRSIRSVATRALAGGVLFGVAASMRTEALVYVVTTVAVGCFVAGFPRRWKRPLAIGIPAAVGLIALFVANIGLELAVIGGSYRSIRASGAASAGGQDFSFRAREGLTTLLSLAPSLDLSYVLAGLAFVIGLGGWALAAAGKIRPVAAIVIGIAVAVLVIVQRVSDGPGFWPGLFATTPLAAVGLFLGWSSPARRRVVLMALVPLPLVFVFEFPGGALPQWGGRYILLSGLLLEVVGVVALVRLPRSSRTGLIGVAVVVTLLGLAWSSQRTHDIARAGDALAARPEEVLISPDGFPPREFGATWGTKKWMATLGAGELPGAIDVARQAGVDTFAIVELDGQRQLPDFPGYHEVGRSSVPLIDGTEFTLVSYAAN
jgi:hypothetical protein